MTTNHPPGDPKHDEGAAAPARSEGRAGDQNRPPPYPTKLETASPAGTVDSRPSSRLSVRDEPKAGLPLSGAEKRCDLCEAARFTHWYYEDDTCWIADCEVCSVPMVVWKPHGITPTQTEVAHMLEQLEVAGEIRFGEESFALDRKMRTIPDHWHAHARDSDWFRLRMARPLSRYTAVGANRVER